MIAAPDGLAWGFFQDAGGARIRYGHLPSKGPARHTLVIVGGFCEPAEKYFEVMAERAARGANVWIMDWKGQGGSDRFLPRAPMKSHHAGYDGAVKTLYRFATGVVNRAPGVPLVLFGHSMGGHLALRFLGAHPGVFDAAVLTDPMVSFRTDPLPRAAARAIAGLAVLLGLGERYVPGAGPWTPAYDVFEGNPKTSDPARFRVQPDLFAAQEDLRAGGATFGWVWRSFQSCAIVQDAAFLKSIKTPILLEISGDNAVVHRAAALRAAALLPRCKWVDFSEAKHEIWMESDAIRDRWVAAVDSFLDRLAPASAA